jgi:hypothetical protein
VLGCTPAQLRAAKRAGCAGFRHKRVCIAEVREWLATNADKLPAGDDRGALECQKLQRQIRALDFEHAKKSGQHLSADEVRRVWLSHLLQARAVLMSCPAELAPALCGLSAAEIERRLVEKMDAALALLRANPLCPDAGAA